MSVIGSPARYTLPWSSYVTTCEGPGVIPAHTTGTWNNVPMLIPATAPSRLAGCGIINTDYQLKVCRTFMSVSIGYVGLQLFDLQLEP